MCGHVNVCDLLLNRGADIEKANNVWDILYYTVMYTVVIDIIIIIHNRREIHLSTLPVSMVMSQSVTFSSTGELMSTKLIGYGIYYIIQ